MSYSLRAAGRKLSAKPVWHIPFLCVQWKIPDDEQRNCPKHVEFLLTPWCRVLLQKLTGLQLVKKFPAFHGSRRFITALTSVRHLSLSWPSPNQSIYPHPTSWRSILILSTHLRLGLPSGHVGFYSKNKFEKLVRLVGFIIRIYHEARSLERQTQHNHFTYFYEPHKAQIGSRLLSIFYKTKIYYFYKT